MVILIVIIIFLFLFIIIRLLQNYINSINIFNKEYTFNGILNTSLLTGNELKYYNKLKETLANTEYIIFSKVRLADLIKTHNYSDFNKIRSKHIDFVICNKETNPLLFIELDDSSHRITKNHENDIKKDIILKKVGINIIRTKINELDNNMNLIIEKLNTKKDASTLL